MNKKKRRYALMKGIGTTDRIIKEDARKNKLVIYGMQSVAKQAPTLLFGRTTEDYDIYSKTPKKAARRVERKLDKAYGGDFFYVKPARHPGTHKVMSHVGDAEVADYSKPVMKRRVVRIQRNRYTHLNESIRDKRTSLADPTYKFRHKKDKADLRIMMIWKRLWKKI